jgi:uncharacterized protein (TIGR03437 family)
LHRRFHLLLIALLALGAHCHQLHAQVLRQGFADDLVVRVGGPTALAFLPDGRMLITAKGGALRIWDGQALLPTPALDLTARTCANSERGLLGVAVDPGFVRNGFIYLYYTHRNTPTCGSFSLQGPMNRVSRFTFTSANTVDPATELVLVDNIWSYGGNHNAGDLEIGGDGHLYISTGDGGTDYQGRGAAGANPASRERHHLMGKVLRITTSGAIPADNPFTGPGTVRCHQGAANPGQVCQETYLWGLRNPFRFAFNPNDGGRQFYINDVGQAAWEEVNEAIAGADYGWNTREGNCVNGSTTQCAPGNPTPGGLTDPIFAYAHSALVPGTTTGNCRSITGGAFVPNGYWPAGFDGGYVFSDYICGAVFSMQRSGQSFTASELLTGLDVNSAVHLRFGPFGATQALYYTTFAGGGEVRRIRALASSLTNVSAASFDAGPAARASILSGFGSGLADAPAGATQTPLPTQLGATRIDVRQEGQPVRGAPLFFVSPSQVNYQLPSAAVPGRATVEVVRNGNVVASESVLVQDLRPALFTANQSGRGVPAGEALLVRANGAQEPLPLFVCSGVSGACAPAPLPQGAAGESVFVILYGTGLRIGTAAAPVRVTVDGIDGEVRFVGEQPQFVGLDQVNVRLPKPLPAGRDLELRVHVGTQVSNPVLIRVQ